MTMLRPMIVLTTLLGLLVAGTAAGHGKAGGGQSVNVNITVNNGVYINAPGHGAHHPRRQPPVALPEKGALFTTGQIGNYSAVPYPVTKEDTARGRRNTSPAAGHGETRRDRSRHVRSHALGTERKVIRLEDNVRKVRSLDTLER